jgi:ketosteroid isomerase-like protein
MARSQKFTVFLSSFIASGIFLFAGNPARTGSPQEDALASLIEAERAFARAAEEKGVREAFLTYLAEGAIVFRPAPVEGRPLYEKMSPDNPALLTWTPEVAEVSASGDLGYTSGPGGG